MGYFEAPGALPSLLVRQPCTQQLWTYWAWDGQANAHHTFFSTERRLAESRDYMLGKTLSKLTEQPLARSGTHGPHGLSQAPHTNAKHQGRVLHSYCSGLAAFDALDV